MIVQTLFFLITFDFDSPGMKSKNLALHLPKLIFSWVMLLLFINARSQTVLCPPNLDFENGDYSGWTFQIGGVTTTSLNWFGTGQVNDRHTLVSKSANLTDYYGEFPQVCPNGGNYSLRLGNSSSGAEAESAAYSFSIPSGVSQFSIIYYYAVVLQDPNHLPEEQPRFRANVVDEATGASLNCVNFDFTASSSLPGFSPSRVNPQVLYKDWTPITLDLTPYAGHTVRLEFITNDCTKGGHFGYAYIDVSAFCNGAIIGSTICEGETTATLKAPFGFAEYHWYSDETYTNELSSDISLNLDPAPAVGTIYPVIVVPYAGFGCRDTLFAKITTSARPTSIAGPDQSVCKGVPVQLGFTPSATGFLYEWTSEGGVIDNPGISGPMGSNPTNDPVNFIVKTTDLLTGCFSKDTMQIITKVVDTTMQVNGKLNYCDNEPITTQLQLNQALTSVQWFVGSNPVGGAVNPVFAPSASGDIQAQISQYGCSDVTRLVHFQINPLPTASFIPNNDTQCVKSNFVFTNQSSILPVESLSYQWDFGDNTSETAASPTKDFATPGVYTISLEVTSGNQCKDNTSAAVYVLPNAIADFEMDTVCTSRAMQFRNITDENGSPAVTYHWDFGNTTSSDAKTPPPVIYDQPGLFNATLMVTALGCENESLTLTKAFIAHSMEPGIRYPDITIAEGYSNYIRARDTIGTTYLWAPATQLNATSISTPLFTAVNDQQYTITISDQFSCITVDTLQVLVLKKKGVYMPTAFTPNGDGRNDVVRPYVVRMKSLKRFSIFNRSGNLVFMTTKPEEAWDGTYRGKAVDNGVYVWMVEYIDTDDKALLEKGTVTVIR